MMTNNSDLGSSRDPFTGLSGPAAPSTGEEGGQRTTWKAVYTIADRGNGRKHWLRIGVAFVNRDGSLNVRLDAVPVSGQLHIRDASPRDNLGGREVEERSEYGNC